MQHPPRRALRRGASLMAYGLLVGLIAVVALGVTQRAGTATATLFGTTADRIRQADTSGVCEAPPSGAEASTPDRYLRTRTAGGFDLPETLPRSLNGSPCGYRCLATHEVIGGVCVPRCPDGFTVSGANCVASGFGCSACPSGANNVCGTGPGYMAGTASACSVPGGYSQVSASYSSYNGLNYGNNSGTFAALCYHHGASPNCGNRGNIQPANPNASYDWTLTIRRN